MRCANPMDSGKMFAVKFIRVNTNTQRRRRGAESNRGLKELKIGQSDGDKEKEKQNVLNECGRW